MSNPVIHCPTAADIPDWPEQAPWVKKIVIGEPLIGGEKKPLKLDSLPDRFAARFPNLTHLYLWQIEGLRELPALPSGLQCLDVRDCEDLRSLPDLPSGLEILDAGGCVNLSNLPAAPKKLERFYFNDCAAITDWKLHTFLNALSDAPLVEADGSRSMLSSLDEMPRKTLRKLVLAGCKTLATVNGLEAFPALDHLNLAGCTALTTLPNLPPGLRYLRLHGTERLTDFMGQGINAYDRGSENENVARAFHTRKKFGAELAVMPCAKLLLMGDGRVGKSTLAKRLQWDEMPDGGRQARPDLKPSDKERYTPRVQFGTWNTGLRLEKAHMAELEERVAAAGISLPRTKAGDLAGGIRVWDFGGQELYHGTHRIFAREGAVFLLVWCEKPPDVNTGRGEERIDDTEWREWNRQRSLDYWFDYIRSLTPNHAVKIALVCTRCPSGTPRPDWQDRAPRTRGLSPEMRPKVCYVESLKEDPAPIRELTDWIHEECAKVADSLGIVQPRFFAETGEFVEAIMQRNLAERNPLKRALMFDWAEWSKKLRDNHARSAGPRTPALDEHDIDTITAFLHQAGNIFHITTGGQRAVLIDHNRAAELIYEILRPGGYLHETVKSNGGWFYGFEIKEAPEWRDLDEIARTRLLAYMQECELIVRLADARRSMTGQDIFLALDKWLLPKYPSAGDLHECDEGTRNLRRRVDAEMEFVKAHDGMTEREKFEIEDVEITEFQFRSLMAHLAGVLGVKATYFRNAIQALDPAGEAGILRVRWRPMNGDVDAFTGHVDVVLVAKGSAGMERMSKWLEEAFDHQNSPFHQRFKPRRKSAGEYDLAGDFLFGRRSSARDLGISSSGEDHERVEGMTGAMLADGIRVNWYREEQCRLGDMAELKNFMRQLLNEDRMMLVVSEGYLRGSAKEYNAEDCERNWFCAYELADTIVRFASGERAEKNTVVVIMPGNGFSTQHFQERAHRLLIHMETHFRMKYADHIKEGSERKFNEYQLLYQRFAEARSDDAFNRFMDRFGSDAALWRYAEVSPDNCRELVCRIRERIPKQPARP